MGGGLMQLVAYGAQDIYLTGNPQITFFKVVYRRHTNFSMEAIEQTFNGQADFGRKVTCTISRNGDLIHRVYLQVTLPAVTCQGTPIRSENENTTSCSYCFRWANYIGHVLIRSVEVEIGGQRIDRHYGDWLNIWNELTQEPGKQAGYDNMVGNTVALTGTALNSTEATTLYVPLQFWFCRNPGLALPLIALQYHEVKINLEFRQKEETYATSSSVLQCGAGSGCTVCVPSLEQATYLLTISTLILMNVVVLLRFHTSTLLSSFNLLVTNLSLAQMLRLSNFNHPCKELIWVVQRDDVVAPTVEPTSGIQYNTNQWNNYTDDYDLDTAWSRADPGAAQLLYTNVESGWSSMSFPSTFAEQTVASNIDPPLSTGRSLPLE